jgi:hypothetical protein
MSLPFRLATELRRPLAMPVPSRPSVPIRREPDHSSFRVTCAPVFVQTFEAKRHTRGAQNEPAVFLRALSRVLRTRLESGRTAASGCANRRSFDETHRPTRTRLAPTAKKGARTRLSGWKTTVTDGPPNTGADRKKPDMIDDGRAACAVRRGREGAAHDISSSSVFDRARFRPNRAGR